MSNMIKDFEWYKKEGIAYEVKPDRKKATWLKKKAGIESEFIERIQSWQELERFKHILVEVSYSCLMKLVRSLLYVKGYATKGKGSHKAEIAFLDLENVSQATIKNLDTFRKVRNKIKYSGTMVTYTQSEIYQMFRKIYEDIDKAHV